MPEGAGQVALLVHEQREVVFGDGDRERVLEGLVDRQGSMGVVRRSRILTGLLVGQAQVAVHVGEPAEVRKGGADGGRLLVGLDRLGVLVTGVVDVAEDGKDRQSTRLNSSLTVISYAV